MRTEAQQRYYLKNKERLDRESREWKQRPEVKAERSKHDAENRNERNSILGWRWMKWSEMLRQKLSFDYGILAMVNQEELDNPRYVFIYKGNRKKDNLHEPFPAF